MDLIEPSAHLLAEARKRLTGPGPKCGPTSRCPPLLKTLSSNSNDLLGPSDHLLADLRKSATASQYPAPLKALNPEGYELIEPCA